MHARRDEARVAEWRGDWVGAGGGCEIEQPYFDRDLDAWVMSRYRDIAAVLQDARACPVDVGREDVADPQDEAMRAQMRAETLEALSAGRLREWQEALTPEVERALGGLVESEAVDLLAQYAEPVCLRLAAMVTGVTPETAEGLRAAARAVSARAAEPYNEALGAPAKAAGRELMGHFHAECEVMRDSTFVALSQTVPCLLGNAWYALIQHPAEWKRVHEQPELAERAVEELMRYAGLVRTLGRVAAKDMEINGCVVRKGERMVLRVIAANRDPERFERADEVDVTRRASGNLALGAGPHACAGASLIRMAAVTLTRPLVEKFASAKMVGEVEWRGGAGFRAPVALWVELRK